MIIYPEAKRVGRERDTTLHAYVFAFIFVDRRGRTAFYASMYLGRSGVWRCTTLLKVQPQDDEMKRDGTGTKLGVPVGRPEPIIDADERLTSNRRPGTMDEQ